MYEARIAAINNIDKSFFIISHLNKKYKKVYHINIKKAAMTGLFSDVPISHIQAVGNSCLLGLADISPESNHVLNRLGNMQKISEICR